MSEAQAKKPAKSGELIRANKRKAKPKAKLRGRAKSDTLHGYNFEAQTAQTPQKTTAFAPSAVKNFGLGGPVTRRGYHCRGQPGSAHGKPALVGRQNPAVAPGRFAAPSSGAAPVFLNLPRARVRAGDSRKPGRTRGHRRLRDAVFGLELLDMARD